MQLTQRLVKQRHSHCMAWFEQLETQLHDLYLNSSPHDVDAFKPAFHSFFGEEHQTFRLKMFRNLDQLRLQLEKENLLEVNPRTCLDALRTQFKEFFASKRVNSSEHLNQCWQKDFKEYMFCEPDTYRRDLLENLDTLEAVIHRAVITYGRLQLQSQDVQINPVQAVDDSLNVSKSSWIELENHNALSKSVNETQLQQHESLVTESTTLEANLNSDVKALDVGSVITESSETKSDMHDTSSSSRTYITHVVDANIRPVNDQVPSAEVHLTAPHNVLATEQYQAKSPLLKAELVKSKEMIEKETYNELSRRFLLLEKHCISLEISMQQKEESFQSNKPCKNQDAPEFCEFFEINDLKAQLQAKTTLICNLKNQIKSVKEASNEAKVKHEIDVLETINIELESSVAKLLAENEKLNKENEHLKQTYKELYDSIKKTRIQTKDHNDSLIAQVNSKTVENADLKAQIQEKVFANVALKNELRKLKGNSVDTKFAKPSILGKPVLQPPRNQLVVRQPNAFKSERPNFSKPRFASQVDVNNVLSKPVTPHYLPKVREYVLAKPHHVIAPGSFRNSQEEPYGSNDMAHNHYLEEARKKTQERNRNSKPSVMHTTSLQNTTNGSKPNPRSNNQISRSLPVSKSSCGMSNGVSLVDHSRNSSSFSDSKHFVCSTCHKCVFNANHDNCITKFLKEVNSRAKIAIGQMFSPKKSSTMHEKPNTPRSCLRWKSMGRIFKIAGLRWIPTGKMFTDNTTKVDSEPPNGSNDDITNPYECDQTLNVSAGLVPQSPSPTPNVPPTKNDWDLLFCPMFDDYFNPSPSVVQPILVAGVQESVVSIGTPSSTRIDQDTPSTSTSQTTQEEQSYVIPTSVEEDDHGIEVAHMNNDLGFEKQGKSRSKRKMRGWLYSVGTEFSWKISSQTSGQEKLEFLMKNVGMQSMSPEMMKKLAEETEELWWFRMQHMLWKLLNEDEACLTIKFNNFPKVQVKDLEVHDVSNDEENKTEAVVAEKQARYVQTNLTLSSAELEIQSMVDVPIHQEDLAVQRTPLIDPVISMTFQKEFRSAGWCKENRDGQKTIAEDMGFNPLVHSFRVLSTLRRSGLRTASASAKTCQGDSLEFYLITGRIPTVVAAGQRHKSVSMPVRRGKLIQKLLLNQKCMGYLVRAYYCISPTSFQDTQLIQKLRDDKKCMKKVEPLSKSKTIEDIISIGSFVEAIVLNHYVLVRKIL
ncbi:hypothetical protein Tco_0652575 [Tanacetum coccineum]|uniref:Retrotransposon gag domain-containing protein n=1 Tax=Tanacetum coccineum TaxID=301880 RepID=A0ABQ4WXZ4_9ASTR